MKKRDHVGLVTLNRPDALIALSSPLMKGLNDALREFAADDSVGAIVLAGSERAFAVGADIKQIQPLTMVGNIKSNYLGDWSGVNQTRKPIVATVNRIFSKHWLSCAGFHVGHFAASSSLTSSSGFVH
ncbi:hypothetical protein HK405_012653 [Cladochytrium tenue]|nr:hypothetical protein HK405_012653 [Cladochytrium tenue]